MLAADLSLDGYVGRDDLGADWAQEYVDDELARYQRRVVFKAGLHALERDWAVDDLAAAKSEGGREELAPIVAQGGAGYCQELTRRRLVDEYRVTVHPIVFGEGHRLFAVRERLYLIGTRFFSGGSLGHTYVPEHAYRDLPPPLPWAQGPGEHDHHPEPQDPAEGPAPG